MEKEATSTYLLCPRCQRAVPTAAKENYCPNDGSKMLSACPHCQTPISSPYSRFCTGCGGKLLEDVRETSALKTQLRTRLQNAASQTGGVKK